SGGRGDRASRQRGHGRRLRAALRTLGAARRRNRLGPELGPGALTNARAWRQTEPSFTRAVIPGRGEAANPESIFQRLVSMDSGLGLLGRPGMTPSTSRRATRIAG